jgi:hypothetical protein
MPYNLTKKYRKNNRKSKYKRGGGPDYESAIKNQIKIMRNPNIKWEKREIKRNDYVKHAEFLFGKPQCRDLKFGNFTCNYWGGNPVNGCGFNIWDHNGKKFWIDIDPYFNIAAKIKDESGWVGVDDVEKNKVLSDMSPEERTPDKTPNFFLQLFPQGYKESENGPLIEEIKTSTSSPVVTPPVETSQVATSQVATSSLNVTHPIEGPAFNFRKGGTRNKRKKSNKHRKTKSKKHYKTK